MQKQMKLITTAGVLGLFLVGNYAFDLLGKLGAGIVSAVLTGQLTAEAMNGELYAAIGKQALPFLVMMMIGTALLSWSRGKNTALAATAPEWAAAAPERKATEWAIFGGLMLFAGLYNLVVPIYFGFQDLVAGLSSPESAGYVLKAVLPNYLVLVVQIIVGIWLMIGMKTKETPVVEAVVPVEEGEAEAEATISHTEAVSAVEDASEAEETNKAL